MNRFNDIGKSYGISNFIALKGAGYMKLNRRRKKRAFCFQLLQVIFAKNDRHSPIRGSVPILLHQLSRLFFADRHEGSRSGITPHLVSSALDRF
jgi:hypothetical protein